VIGVTKTGFIAIVGRPNVGKSTILNALLGEKVAIVSSKPQTTRTRITGILTRGESQFVFLDTPGIHDPKNKLGGYMVRQVSSAIADVDAAILVAHAGFAPGETEKRIIKRLRGAGMPIILALNKTDLADAVALGNAITEYAKLCDFAAVVPMCASKGKGTDILLDEADKLLLPGEWHFESDELTDQPERAIASEIIREKLLRLTNDEIPHGSAVVIEEFKESGSLIKIRAEIYCEKASHKGIIIGKNGELLKRIGSYARADMESFFGTKVFLDLWVRVKENWRESALDLRALGFNDSEDR